MKYPMLVCLLVIACFIGCKKKDPLEVTTIRLNSIVCKSCVKTVSTAIYRVEGVKEVNIDLKAKTAEVKFVPVQTNLETIEQAITEAGYNANDKKRNSDAYDKLDACCKIDG